MKQGILLIGAAGIGYYLYTQYSKTAVQPGTVYTGGTNTGTSTGVTPINPASLQAIYNRIAASVPSNQLYTADQWNTYLSSPTIGKTSAPDPLSVWTDPTWDRNAPMSLTQYWAQMSPWLHTNVGLSGGWLT